MKRTQTNKKPDEVKPPMRPLSTTELGNVTGGGGAPTGGTAPIPHPHV